MPFYVEPLIIGMACAITALGIPVYMIGVMWKTKPKLLVDFMGKFFVYIFLKKNKEINLRFSFFSHVKYQLTEDLYGCEGRIKRFFPLRNKTHSRPKEQEFSRIIRNNN
jgi:hypothetical protein